MRIDHGAPHLLGHDRYFFDDVRLAINSVAHVASKRHTLNVVHEHIIHRENFIVAKMKQGQEKLADGWNKAKWVGFTSVPVSESDAGDIERWAETADVDALMDALIGDGYKINLSLVDRGETVMVGVNGAYDRCGANAGLFLSAYAPDIRQALVVALYKHFVICQGGDWPRPDTARVGRIG